MAVALNLGLITLLAVYCPAGRLLQMAGHVKQLPAKKYRKVWV